MSTQPGFVRDTVQRRAIRSALQSAGRPLAPEEVLDSAKGEAPGLGLATVYRTLKALVSSGEAKPVDLPGASPRYEVAGSGRHHHHFRCNACDRVYELEGCVPAMRSLVPRGFKLTSHELLLEGVCAACA